jgi:TPR repeat protein
VRRVALAALVLLGCREKSEPKPAPQKQETAGVTVTVEPTAAADAAIAAIGKLLQPSAPVMGFAEILPHLHPLAVDCKKGSDLACAVFANLYRYGVLVAHKAPAEEVARLDDACGQDKDPAACALAGEAHRDQAKAKQAGELFTLACSQGIAQGCALGGDLDGLTRACDLADFGACEELVGKAGAEAGRRTARALAIFQAACARHHHPSCDAAETLSRELRGEKP